MSRRWQVVCFASILLALSFPMMVIAASQGGTSATAGFRVGDGVSGGFIDLLAPVYSSGKGMAFVNPRLSLADGGENEVNVGAGWRQLAFDDRAVLGGNVYFDSRHTESGHRFNQLGIGVELLSRWFDARANYYLPEDTKELVSSETTTEVVDSADYGQPYAREHLILQRYQMQTTTTRRTFERWESAMEGFDAEVGCLVPLPDGLPQVRLFAGYYSFEDGFGKRVEGPKGRVEVRIGSYLTLDGEVFDDDELNGTGYYAGARFDTPFDVAALFAGANPFAGWNAPPDAAPASRMTEMVMRDMKVQAGVSEPIENESAREVTVQVTGGGTAVLMDDVTFVDDGNTSGIEDGTAEHPFSGIQDGVDNAFGKLNVYVFGGTYSSVELTEGVTLWGEGTAVEGLGGRAFGGGDRPVIVGTALDGEDLPGTGSAPPVVPPPVATDPGVIMADDTRVTGFSILATDTMGITATLTGGSVTIDNNIVQVLGVSDAGASPGGIMIVGGGDVSVEVVGNDIRVDSASGGSGGIIAMVAGDGSVMQGTIADNVVEVNTTADMGSAMGIAVFGLMGTVDVDVTGNAVTATASGTTAWASGIYAVGFGGMVDIAIGGNTVTATASGTWSSAMGIAAGTLTGAGLFSIEDNGVTTTASGIDAAASGITLQVVGGIGEFFAGGNTVSASAEGTGDVSSVGINFMTDDGMTGVEIVGNAIAAGSEGINLEVDGGVLTADVQENGIQVGDVGGIGIEYLNTGADASLAADGNTISGAAVTGISVVNSGGTQEFSASGNTIGGGLLPGIVLINNPGGTFTVDAATPGAAGDLSSLNGGTMTVYVGGFTFLP